MPVLPVTFTHPPVFWIPDEGSGWIDFSPIEGGQILIPVLLNGDRVQALIDTGFNQLVIGKAYADAHHLPLTPWATAVSVGGPTPYYTTPAVSISVGELHTTEPGGVTVVDLDHLTGVVPEHFDVVIGLPLLGTTEWEIDEDKHRFRILKSKAIPLSSGTPIRIGPHNSRLVTDVTINGRSVAPAMIDTGSDDEVSLAPMVAEEVAFKAETDVESVGAGGSIVQPKGRLGEFTIGTHTVSGTDATILDESWAGKGIRVLVGMGVLRAYNMTVDLAAGLMTLAPRTTPSPPIPKSTSGVQGPFRNDRLTITHVMRDSPAAMAGLKAGDQICAINGRPMSQDMIDRHWGRAAPGTRYVLKLCDGTSRNITLRAFY